MITVGSDNGAYLGSGVNSNGERVIRMYYQGKLLDQLTPKELSNAHGAQVQDAKSKYLDDLSNIPGLEVKVRSDTTFSPMLGAQPLRRPGEPDPPQQTVGEAIKQALDAKGARAAAEVQRLTFQWYPDDPIERLKRQHLEVVSAILNGKKDKSPMDNTEVVTRISEALKASKDYTDDHMCQHVHSYHEPKPPRSRAPWYVAGYVLAAFGTFVHIQHYSYLNEMDRKFFSIPASAAWPMYWVISGVYYAGKGALALDDYATSVIKPTPKVPAKSCTDDKSGSWGPDVDGICHMPLVKGEILKSIPSGAPISFSSTVGNTICSSSINSDTTYCIITDTGAQ